MADGLRDSSVRSPRFTDVSEAKAGERNREITCTPACTPQSVSVQIVSRACLAYITREVDDGTTWLHVYPSR
jgi:hypothetical protein